MYAEGFPPPDCIQKDLGSYFRVGRVKKMGKGFISAGQLRQAEQLCECGFDNTHGDRSGQRMKGTTSQFIRWKLDLDFSKYFHLVSSEKTASLIDLGKR